ncbi:MAG TPA: DUF2062 domain-containing protein [Thermohalobaculum sp.]|nr:DUF2062 domain-containing protein [Thermohalobaculum sp.]
MIFKRRDRPPFWSRLREVMYPRKGVWRGIDYIRKRLHRLPDSPHRIALGFACGAFVSFTPFFTLHFFLAALIAWMLRGNVLASVFGTAVGNPLTFPFISVFSLWLGRAMLGRTHDAESGFEAVSHGFAEAISSILPTVKSWFGYGESRMDGLAVFFDDVFLPYLIGGILPGLLCGVFCYWLIGPIVEAYQTRRRKRLEKRAAQRRTAIDKELAAYRASDGKEGDNA